MPGSEPIIGHRIVVVGRVQGVGYRPFVYRLALHHRLRGWVRNRTGRVEIHAAGPTAAVERFAAELTSAAPPLARPRLERMEAEPPQAEPHFRILSSAAGDGAAISVPPDYFACDDCLAEVRDPEARRYRYPFTNCTQCGPRYTLIRALPYDRPNTAMADFPLCPDCRSEYEDPADRRFHAQPLACPRCGPQLHFIGPEGRCTREAALTACRAALMAGAVVAVKGVGGYHLLCNATDPAAVTRLRSRKRRPGKPLAVLFPQRGPDGLAAVRAELDPEAEEARLLSDPMRPIVLVRRRADARLAPEIAPGLDEVGAMLPYSPLHHLLLEACDGPLVATSGNLSGEPVLTDPEEAGRRLQGIADAFLHHDRPILRPADDPLYRTIAGRPRPLRLGRGVAPLELMLPAEIPEPTLAVGGHMKNAIALAWGQRVVISPHIGDMETPRSREVFNRVAADLQRLYGITAQQLACDAHPGYATSRWARERGLPLLRVQHHAAHASALYGEHRGHDDWLVFTWDGTGMGEDGTLWGGETLQGRPGAWRRVGSLRPFRLPGGEKAGREPWRSAAALCWEVGEWWAPAEAEMGPIDLLQSAWRRGINSPLTTAAGRLFDAAAALTGLCSHASFEGEGPMLLEAAAEPTEGIDLPLLEDGELLRIDWAPLLPLLRDAGRPAALRAGLFHATLARAMTAQAVALRHRHPCSDVALGGGVFQNRRLAEAARTSLERAGFTVHLPRQVPGNDGGLCYGQVIEALHRA